MEFRDYIARAEEAAGGTKKLADTIGIAANAISDAKAHRRGIPEKACVLIAQIAKTEPMAVIAAREEALAKTAEEKAFWHKIAKTQAAKRIVRAASFT